MSTYKTQAETSNALNALDDRPFITGLSLTIRTGGQKGQRGNALTNVPIIGVCPEGSSNPYTAKALKSVDGAYQVLPDSDGMVQGYRDHESARNAATDILRNRDNAKLATMSPIQAAQLEVIKDTQRSIRALTASLKVHNEEGMPTEAIEDRLSEVKETIEAQREQMRAL